MPQREFTMQVRYHADTDEAARESFKIVAHVMRRACQMINGKLLIIGGSTKPDIKLYSDDFIEGIAEIDAKLQEGDADALDTELGQDADGEERL